MYQVFVFSSFHQSVLQIETDDQLTRILRAISSDNFKLQVVIGITFQTKYRNKSSLFFLKRSFYPIKT